MSKAKITFISSRGRGMDNELKLIQKKIEETDKKVSFQYFIKNEITKNKAYAEGLKATKKKLADGSEHVICMDMSLNVKVSDMPDYGKKVLVMAPFNYLHEAMFQKQNNPSMANKKGTAMFTHVYSTSPFNTELLKKAYDIDGVQIIEGFASPYCYYIADPAVQKEYRDTLEMYYPASKGKKLMTILLRGAKGKEDAGWFLPTVDWKKFLDSMGEEWFFITDDKEVMSAMSGLDASYRNCFGYTSSILTGQEISAIADLMVTNYGVYAAYQASRKKPCYTIPHNNSNYERYIKKNYPELSIDNEEQLLQMREHAKEHAALHEEFSSYYSYAPDKNMVDHIIQLLEQK